MCDSYNLELNRFGRFYTSYLGRFVPMYAVLPLIFSLILNQIIYSGSQILMQNAYHYDLSTGIDNKFPLIPQWSVIYLGCYLFWGINYILISRQSKEIWYRFITAEYLSKIICLLFFIFLPTYILRPEITGSGFSNFLMRIIYSSDSPTNLFPSIHCLASWYCYIGIRGNKNIPFFYRIFSLIFAVLVFFSTLYTRQHVIVDIFGGVILAEVCLFFSNKTNAYKLISKPFESLKKITFEVNKK